MTESNDRILLLETKLKIAEKELQNSTARITTLEVLVENIFGMFFAFARPHTDPDHRKALSAIDKMKGYVADRQTIMESREKSPTAKAVLDDMLSRLSEGLTVR